MVKQPGRAAYQSPLRARLKEQTSLLILEAVGAILMTDGLAAVSIAEVARVAEVTERTVYRHFPTRDDLVRAFIAWHLEHAVGGPHITLPRTIDELLAWLGPRYEAWARDRGIVSQAYLSPVGRELRKPLFELGYANIVRMLTQERPELSVESRRFMAAAMLTLMSTENFVFLYENLGYSPDEVHMSVVAAINAMRAGATAPRSATPGS
jgi:AcrR family transcriptional regulator